jgi:hypothetical protein
VKQFAPHHLWMMVPSVQCVAQVREIADFVACSTRGKSMAGA